MKKTILSIILISAFVNISAIEGYMFRIYLKNKGKTEYTLDNPETYLSKKSIERRYRQKLEIDSTDLPISKLYINKIEELGCVVVAKSKWMSTVSVYSEDSLITDRIKQLDFVKGVDFAWKGDTHLKKESADVKRSRPKTKPASEYGYALDQIATVNGIYLHEQGLKGEGMEIAVIDAGFENINDLLLIDNAAIIGAKDFVYNGVDMFKSSEHGLNVVSTMMTNVPNTYIGTAPKAKYLLLRSEDNRSEYPIEEDYWVTAAEYADSIGVDLINTSLGYTKFDYPAHSYNIDQLNGKTAYISRGAGIAARKGLFMAVSAGNEGATAWHKISFPADAENVLTVGSINKDSVVSYFSSVGPTADMRIKPDVMAMGGNINLIGAKDEIIVNSGTSFACPVMCGLAACLWQAFPNLTSLQVMDVINRSGSKYTSPGDAYGYGIPDMKKAFEYAKGFSNEIEHNNRFFLKSDSIGVISVQNINNDDGSYKLMITDLNGQQLLVDNIDRTPKTFNLNRVAKYMYIISITGNGKKEVHKVYF